MHKDPSGKVAERTTSYQEIRRRLRPLLKNKRLGFPAFEAYAELWERVGLSAGKIAITGVDLAGLIGRDVRRVRDWIDAWARFGLVDLIAYDAPTNTFHLYVDEPERAFQPQVVHAPPQVELFGGTAGETAAEPPRVETAAEPRRNRRDENGQKTLCFEDGGTAGGGTAAKPPSMDHGTIEGLDPTFNSSSSSPIGSASAAAAADASEKKLISNTGSPAETSRASDSLSVAEQWAALPICDQAAIAKINELRRQHNPPEPPPDANDPAQTLEREKRRIVGQLSKWADELAELCDSRKRMSLPRARQIADHVLVDGLAESELWELCETVESDWLADRTIRNPVGVFDHRFEQLIASQEISTRAKAKRRRA